MKKNYQRITLYFKLDDENDSLRYAFIGSLGKNKKTIFEKMIDKYLYDYGIENLEDLTLKDLQEIKRDLMGKDCVETKEKRPRGRPKKVSNTHSEHNLKEFPASEPRTPVISEEPKNIVRDEEFASNVIAPEAAKKAINPMSVHVNFSDEDDIEEDEGGIDMGLFSQLNAFGGR